MNKNLWIITASQIFSFTPAPVNVFLSGIIGSTLSPIKSLQTLPTSLMIVGVAFFSFFAAKIMSRIGRKAGFLYAAFFSSFSVLLAAYAVWDKNFYLFFLSCFFIGCGMSFTHQYRFAAAESVEKSLVPKALSIIMLATIFSALLGPNIANLNKSLIHDHLFVGSYLSLAVLTFIPVIFLIFYNSGIHDMDNHNQHCSIERSCQRSRDPNKSIGCRCVSSSARRRPRCHYTYCTLGTKRNL